MRNFAIYLLFSCLILPAQADIGPVKERLSLELSTADRIEIYAVAETVNQKGEQIPKVPLGVIEANCAGRAFLFFWSIEERHTDWQCMCDGDLYIDFFRNTKKIQRLRYFHGLMFRLEDGALTGSVWIKKEDRPKVLEWLNHHGAASLRLRIGEEPNCSASRDCP